MERACFFKKCLIRLIDLKYCHNCPFFIFSGTDSCRYIGTNECRYIDTSNCRYIGTNRYRYIRTIKCRYIGTNMLFDYFIIISSFNIEMSTYRSVPISRQTDISTRVEISVRRDIGASIQRVNPKPPATK